jgi:hypothetical protein
VTAEKTGNRRYKHARTVVALLVVACVLAPIAGTSIWINNQVTKTDRYVRTMKPLASNPAVQAAIATNVTNALFQNVDVAARAREALPPRAKFLAGPLANGLRTFTENATRRFLASPTFQTLWVELNRRAHHQLVKVLTGKGRLVHTRNGRVVIDLAPVLARVKQRLHDRGVAVFDQVPQGAIPTSFVLFNSKQLGQAQGGVRLLKAVAIGLPLLVLALIAAAIALSERRRRTLLQASLGIAASMAVLGILLTLGRSVYLDHVAGPNLPRDAATAFYEILVHYLRLGLRIVAAVALLIAAGAFITGPSRAAVAIRSRFDSAVGRGQGATHTSATPLGRWVARNKRALQAGALLLPLAIFLLWSSPTVTLLIILAVVALVLLLVIEILGRASGPAELAAPTSAT